MTANPAIAPTDVAIVAAECRFPGIDGLDDLHRRIRTGTPVTGPVGGEAPGDPVDAPGYLPVGSDPGPVEEFDPAVFGMSDREAELLEPQARVLHELCLRALDSCGHGFGVGIGRAGVVLGATHPSFLHDRFPEFDPVGGADPVSVMEQSLGSYLDYLATGVAHRLKLTGPSYTVQTACSTSLVAVHLGIQQLLSGESDLVLAGGATIRTPTGRGYVHVPDGPFSADGRTRPYSADATGAVFTQGAGVVALRRATDAIDDGDPILAIIRGSAVNNDGGRSAGLIAPSSAAHAEVIAEAQAMAGVDPRDVTYLEGHGTGTILGDPLEIAAMAGAFGPAERPWCTVGSVKSVLGHSEAASGIAGLLAVVAALRNRELPGLIGTGAPSPALPVEGSALRIADRPRTWGKPDDVLVAGVSSLGFGGTNCHVVVAQAPNAVGASGHGGAADSGLPAVLPHSAATRRSAGAFAEALSDWAARHPGEAADAAWTLTDGRARLPYRGAVVVDSAGRTLDVVRPRECSTDARVVFAFPGGGAQRAGMLEDLVSAHPRWRRELDELSDAVAPYVGGDIRAICAPHAYGLAPVPAEAPLLGLPALVAAEIICAKALVEAGVRPAALIGHSTGEYAAAVVSGALTFRDIAPLLGARSRALASTAAGAMARIRGGADMAENLRAEFPSLEISALNSPASTVVSGDAATISDVVASLGDAADVVPVTVAAHSSFVEPALPRVLRAAEGLRAGDPTLPTYSAATAGPVDRQELSDARHWAGHLRNPVRFHETLAALVRDAGSPVAVVNVGPGASLAALAREAGDPGIIASVTAAGDDGAVSDASVAAAAAELWTAGAELDVPRGRRVPLPPYPFDRRKLWPADPDASPRDGNSPGGSGGAAGSGGAVRSGAAGTEAGSFHRITEVPLPPIGRRDPEPRTAVSLAADAESAVTALPGLLVRHAAADRILELRCASPDIARLVGAALRSLLAEIPVRAIAVAGDLDVTAIDAAAAVGAMAVFDDGRGPRVEIPVPAADVAAGASVALDAGEWELPDVAVILGGGGRVGRALGSALAESGVRVLVGTRGEGPGHVDPANADDVARLLRGVGCGPNSTVIVSTGVVGENAFSEASEIDENTVREHFAAKSDVVGAVADACTMLGVDAPGRVLVMSSLAAHVGGLGLAPYAAANRAAELVSPPPTRTTWTVIASDGWMLGEANSFGDRLLDAALPADCAVRHVIGLLRHPVDGTVLLTRRNPRATLPDRPAAGSGDVGGGRVFSTGDGPSIDAADSADGNATDETASPEHRVEGIRSAWQRALGRDIPDDADFFALGGSSLQATKLLAEVRDRYGLDMRLRDLLADPTFAGMTGRVTVAPAAPAVDARGTDAVSAPETADGYAATATAADGPADRAGAGDGESAPSQSNRTWPLTPVQRAYLTGRTRSFGIAAAACHSFVETVVADLDVERLGAAVTAVIGRHPMLRAIVDAEGHHAVEPGDYIVPVTDCRRGGDSAAALDRWRERNATRTTPADRWPLVSVSVALANDGAHIGWSVDVLVCDAASFGVLFDEVSRAYRGEALPPEPSVHFGDHVRSLSTTVEDAAYWEERAGLLPPAPNLGDPGDAAAAEFIRATRRLDAELDEELTLAAARLGVTPTTVLLTAYAATLAAESGAAELSVVLTVFDRPAGFEGVIGDFTTLVPCALEVTGNSRVDVRSTGAAMFEVLDHATVPAPEILGMRSALDGEPFRLPVVFTSTLGTQVDGGADGRGLGSLVGGASQTPQVILDHQVFLWEGATHVQFDALASVFDAARLDGFLAAYLDNLAAIVAAGEGHSDGSSARADGPAGPELDDADLTPEDAGASPDAAPMPGDGPVPEESGPVLATWARILGVDRAGVDPDSTWAESGGDSLDAIRLVAALRALGIDADVDEIIGGATPAALSRRVADAALPAVPAAIVRHPAGEPFPLTPLQQAYLVGSRGGWAFAHDSAHFYVDYFDPGVTGDALRRAVRALVRHQPMLRAVVLDDGNQVVLDPRDPALEEPPVEVIDLRDADDGAVSGAIDGIRRTWPDEPVDPTRWPSFRVLAHLLPDGGARVHVQASLLFVDGWSFYLFFDQLLTFADDPNVVLPQPSLTFADYTATVAELDGAKRDVDVEWWRRELPALPAPPALPLVSASGHGMVREARRLDAARARELFDRCRERSTTPTAVIGAAWARAVCALTGDEELLLTVLYFNRRPVAEDIDRVLGPFSTTTLITCAPRAWGSGAPDGFTGALARSLAHGAVTGVEVARMLSRHRDSLEVVAPVVFTSTLGFGDGASEAATARIDESDVHERVVTPQVLLDLQASAENGSIAVNLDSPAGAFRPEVTEWLMERVLADVDGFIDGDGFTKMEEMEEPALSGGPSESGVDPMGPESSAAPHGFGAAAGTGATDAPGAVHAAPPTAPTAAWNEGTCSPEALAAVAEEFATALGRPVPADADLYREGGDSLAMIRIVAGLRSRHDLEILPEDFLADPTPAGVAARVRPRLDPASHVLPLCGGTGEPLYLLHPSGGDVLCYMGLARGLGDRPVYAISDPGLEGTPMPVDIAAVADAYAAVIVAHRRGLGERGTHGLDGDGDGLLLGGWSMGGTVAHTLAVLLKGRGVRVAGLILLDSNSPDLIRALTGMDEAEVDAEFARRYLQSLQAFADGDVDASSVTAERPAASVARALDASGLSAGEVERRLSVFTRHLAGLAELSAPTLAGVPALLVEAGERSPANSGVGMGVDDAVGVEKLGWGDALPAATEVATVAAHHYSILKDPALQDVVRLVGGFLARIGDELDAGREEAARPAGDDRPGADHGPGGRPTPAESRTKEPVDGGK